MARASVAFTNWAQPLLADFTIVDRIPEPDIITDAPTLLRLPTGRLLCAFPRVSAVRVAHPRGHLAATMELVGTNMLGVFWSDDDGATWTASPKRLPFICGRLFAHDQAVFYLGAGPERQGIWVSRTTDGGASWSEPAQVFDGLFYAAASSMARIGDRLYWAFGAANRHGRFNAEDSRLVAVACDLSQDPLAPSSWRVSPELAYPGTPQGLIVPQRMFDMTDHWLEPNVVEVGGRIRVFARLRLDHYSTAGMAAVCDLDDDGAALQLRFTQFYPWPGGQNHFHIVSDRETGMYWMLANLPTRTQDLVFWEKVKRYDFKGPPGNERRLLMIFYSIDALNWFPGGCVAMWPSALQAFNYTSPLIDGDDLLIVSRTSRDGANQHDNDLVTFHRLPNFRSLALNLWAEEDFA